MINSHTRREGKVTKRNTILLPIQARGENIKGRKIPHNFPHREGKEFLFKHRGRERCLFLAERKGDSLSLNSAINRETSLGRGDAKYLAVRKRVISGDELKKGVNGPETGGGWRLHNCEGCHKGMCRSTPWEDRDAGPDVIYQAIRSLGKRGMRTIITV